MSASDEVQSRRVTRLRLDLSYEGTNYAGWATQPDHPTVQGLLEPALAVALRLLEPPRVWCAGRTDAGVHARGQVAHVDVPESSLAVTMERLAIQLRALLPNDIVVHRVRQVSADFDARFSCLWRRYEYLIDDRGVGLDPLTRAFVVENYRPLDIDAMNAASAGFPGLRDFAAFCKPRPGRTTIRELMEFRWSRTADGLVRADVKADAFCHSMVRFLVGAMLPVGEGNKPVTWPTDILASGARPDGEPGFNLAPAKGLVLAEVAYPDDSELAARAAATRGRRTLD
ncbi:MAG: tRNA pseudouridine(38-40) synthase TruA [Actinomycetales bacterium]|nr:tRNA pseudouridine(38-40) synthase TruA [Actinomycetales bacterium]